MRYISIFIVVFLVVLLNANPIQIIEQNQDYLLLSIDVENYKLSIDNQFSYLNFSGWTHPEEIGSPNISYKTIHIAVPPDGSLVASIISSSFESLQLEKPISPVPNIQRGESTFEHHFNINESLYRKTSNSIISVGEHFRFRTLTVIPVTISPFLYNYANSTLEIASNIVVKIDISGDTSYSNFIEDSFENFYEGFITNYKTAKYWKTISERKFEKMPFTSSSFWYQFKVQNDGLNKLSWEELSKLPNFCDPQNVRLFTMNRTAENDKYKFLLNEIPISIKNSGNPDFDKYDEIIFEHKNEQNSSLPKYVNSQTYWLTFGGEFASDPKRNKYSNQLENAANVNSFEKYSFEENIVRNDLECIIIYPSADVFLDYAEELESIHSDLICELKSQEDIFAEYSGGNDDPQAIKEYLNEKMQSNLNLEYVVLMGSGTSNWSVSSEKNKIIFDEPSDDRFVNFNQAYLPELIIGRLPAKNNAEMEILLEKIQKYIEEPTPGFWRNKFVMVADDENKKGGYEGIGLSGLNHSRIAQEISDSINVTVNIDIVFGFEHGFDAYQNKPTATEATVEAINEGRLVWFYIGHGNEGVMGDEDYFRGTTHLGLLDNQSLLPLFVAASCDVGRFDEASFDCLAEKILKLDDKGSIISIASTRGCSGSANASLMKDFFHYLFNERENVGNALFRAKGDHIIYNSGYYHILGDPILTVLPPENIGTIKGIQDSIRSREMIEITGNFENNVTVTGEIRVFESDYNLTYINENYHSTSNDTIFYTVNYTKNGNKFYYSNIDINNGVYSSKFFVPDDVHAGSNGQLISYVFDEVTNTDKINSFIPLTISDVPVDSTSISPPQVHLFLDSKTFVTGDFVSTDPLLLAEIEDENGINILGSGGHRILMIIDNKDNLIDITNGFIYDTNSSTRGELSWQIQDLSEGSHSLQIIVFDNLNNPTVAATNFISKGSGKVAIEQMLPYPNPMSDEGHFTFIITENSFVKISIYTITGKKLRIIEGGNLSAGFNKIYWNGKDSVGDRIANNTYFYKIMAKQISNNKVTEKIGKIIILR